MPLRSNLTDTIYYIALMLFFITSHFIGIGAQSFWLDEINLLRIALDINFSSSLMDFTGNVFEVIKNEPHPPLYFVLSKAWISLIGSDPVYLRALSLIWSVLLLLLLGLWSRQQFGERFALVLLLVVALSTELLMESQHFRPYAFVMFAGGAMAIAYLNFLRSGDQNRWLFILGACTMIGALAHYTAVIFAGALAAHQFLYRIIQEPRRYAKWLLISVLIVLPVLPAVVWYGFTFEAMRGRYVVDMGRARDFPDYISPIWAFFNFPGLLLLVILPVAGLTGGVIQYAKKILAKLRDDDLFVTCLLIGVLHYVLIIAASVIQPSLLQNKNILIAFPVMFIAFAKFIMIFAEDMRSLRLAAAAGLLGFLFFLVAGDHNYQLNYYNPWREQVREAAGFIEKSVRPGDTVIFGSVNMNGYYIQPAKVYISAVSKNAKVLKGVERLDFPPANAYDPAQRQNDSDRRLAVLGGALEKAKRTPSSRVLLDLPHSQALSPAENDLLAKSGACIQVLQYLFHKQLLIENRGSGVSCVINANEKGMQHPK